MTRKLALLPILVGIALTTFSSQASSEGFVHSYCWAGSPIGGNIVNPTVGCTMAWTPTGVGEAVDYGGSFYGCDPSCTIVNPTWQHWYSLMNPPSGSVTEQVEFNCLEEILWVSVTSSFVAVRATGGGRGGTGEEVVQAGTRTISGPVGIYCPF